MQIYKVLPIVPMLVAFGALSLAGCGGVGKSPPSKPASATAASSVSGDTNSAAPGAGGEINPNVLAAPTGLAAVSGNATATLTWTVVAGATSYNVYRGNTASGESATAIATGITTTTYVSTGLTNGTHYYFTVKAKDASGLSAASNEAVAFPLTAPAAPTSLAVVSANASAILSWTASPLATSYAIYRGNAAGAESTNPIAKDVTLTRYTSLYLTNGAHYFYIVKAVNAAGVSPASNEVRASPLATLVPPVAPTGLVAVRGNASAALTWNATAGATSYNVYRGNTAGGESTNPVATGVTTTSFTNLYLTNGARYYFVVKAVDALGMSPASNEAVAVPIAPPLAPTSLVGTSGNGSATLTWAASVGATSYNVYRGNAFDGESATPVASGLTVTTYTNLFLTNGGQYYFDVKASNAGGISPASTQVHVVPMAPPVAPTGLTAFAASASANLSWAPVTGATSYNVYRGNTSGAESANPVATGLAGHTYTNLYLTNGARYYFVVRAVNLAGLSPASNEASAKPLANLAPPAAPTGLAATPGNASAALTWTASAAATSYNVYRGTAAGGESATPVVTGLTSLSYTNTALTNGVRYYFVVKAVDGVGTSTASNEATALPTTSGVVPAAPSGVTAAPANAAVTVAWGAVSGATSYNVYRGTAAGAESATAIVTGLTSTSYVDTGLANATKYYYVVKAVNAIGASVASAEVSATPVAAPGSPTGLTATAGNAAATLSWTAVSGATSYNIYRGTATGAESSTAIATGVITHSYTNSGLTNATKYFYKVKAVNPGGTSGFSNETSVTPGGGISVIIQ